MTFTGTSIDLARLSECPFGVTAQPAMRPVAEAIAVELGGDPIWIDQDQRALYHAGLAFGANYMMTLVNESVTLLDLAGIESPQRVVTALFTAALDNALRTGDQALTGPVSRGDAGTVSAHLAELANRSPRTVPAYIELARLTATRAREAGQITADQLARLMDVLK